MYQDIYYFESLAPAFEYIRLTIEEPDLALDDLKPEAEEAINTGMYEYCLSLNEISSALNIFFVNQIITTQDAKMVVNHIMTLRLQRTGG